MKTNTNSKYLIAVLIDGDNVSFERMEDIMGFVSRYGDAVIRRIYSFHAPCGYRTTACWVAATRAGYAGSRPNRIPPGSP